MGNLIESLCTACSGIPRTDIKTLCNIHFFEWQEEKMYGELISSTEDLYI